MSDFNLSAEVYDGMLDRQSAAVERIANDAFQADELERVQSDPESIVRAQATYVAQQLGQVTVRQVYGQRIRDMMHPHSPKIHFDFSNNRRYRNNNAHTPLFGVENGTHLEMALEYGWQLRYGVQPSDGSRFTGGQMQKIRALSTFQVVRVARQISDHSNETAYIHYVLHTDAPIGKCVYSITEDAELNVMQAALRESCYSEIGKMPRADNPAVYDRANERYRQQADQLPTAGPKAIIHCSSILQTAIDELHLA